MNHPPVRCGDVIDLASDRLDGDLTDARRVAYDSHLEACAPCRDFYRSFATTVERAREVMQVTPPPDLAENLIRAFHDRVRQGA